MPANFTTHLALQSAEETAALARAIAPGLGPGDTLTLSGGIGAGKTHFARALIQARLSATGRLEDVPSPTFTLVQTYDDGETEIWHTDLYRVSSADELLELGLEDAFSQAIVLIEWPDRAPGAVPGNALHLTFDTSGAEGARELTITGPADRWKDRVTDAIASLTGNALA